MGKVIQLSGRTHRLTIDTKGRHTFRALAVWPTSDEVWADIERRFPGVCPDFLPALTSRDTYLDRMEALYDKTWLAAFAMQSLQSVAWRMLTLEGCS
jgi:hypothetical protein